MITINKALNLVIELPRDNGTKIYVHSTPISALVFDAYFLVIAKTFDTIYSEGMSQLSGVRVAARLMRKIARDLNVLDGPSGVENGLFGEMRRLSLVIAPTKEGSGWQQITIPEAIKIGLLDDEDVAEVENCLAFFTVLSSMHLKKDRGPILGSALPLWGARLESLNATDFLRSLTTSTVDAPTSSETKASPTPSPMAAPAASSAPF